MKNVLKGRVLGISLGFFLSLTVLATGFAGQEMTQEQQLSGVDAIYNELETHYGMAKYKEEVLGVNLAENHKAARNFIKKNGPLSVEEYEQFLIGEAGKLQDGHTNVLRPSRHYWTLGLHAAEIQGQLVVTGLMDPVFLKGQASSAIQVGDVITHIDGVPVETLAMENLPYVQLATYETRYSRSLESTVNVSHRFFRAKETGKRVDLTLVRPTEERTVQARLAWIDVNDVRTTERFLKAPNDPSLAAASDSDSKMSETAVEGEKPFVYGARGRTSYFKHGLNKLLPPGAIDDIGALVNLEVKNDFQKALKKALGEKPMTQKEIEALQMKPIERLEAYTVHIGDKTVGVIRIPDYSPESFRDVLYEYLWTARVLQRFENSSVQTLIIDQTSNGGGYVVSVQKLVQFFADKQPLDGMMMEFKLNKSTLNMKESEFFRPEGFDGEKRNIAELMLSKQEVDILRTKYEAGERWSGFLPYFVQSTDMTEGSAGKLFPETNVLFTKPVLILNDTRSASGGDFMPAILQANQRALVFGSTSMGLGGPVYREQDSMPGSEMTMRCTMGFCKHADGTAIENIGVVPDVHREITYTDLMMDFIGYSTDALNAALMMSMGQDAEKIQKKTDANSSKVLATSGETKILGLSDAEKWLSVSKHLVPLREKDAILRSLQGRDAILDRLQVLLSFARKGNQLEAAEYIETLILMVEDLPMRNLRLGNPSCAVLLEPASEGSVVDAGAQKP